MKTCIDCKGPISFYARGANVLRCKPCGEAYRNQPTHQSDSTKIGYWQVFNWQQFEKVAKQNQLQKLAERYEAY